MIKPVLRLYVAVADFVNLQQRLSATCVYIYAATYVYIYVSVSRITQHVRNVIQIVTGVEVTSENYFPEIGNIARHRR